MLKSAPQTLAGTGGTMTTNHVDVSDADGLNIAVGFTSGSVVGNVIVELQASVDRTRWYGVASETITPAAINTYYLKAYRTAAELFGSDTQVQGIPGPFVRVKVTNNATVAISFVAVSIDAIRSRISGQQS